MGENIGFESEQLRTFSVAELTDAENAFLGFEPLHICALSTGRAKTFLPEFPGISDDAFITDGEQGSGLITKREVRLNALSMLQPTAGDTAWDVGAGCGGVSIEWARWNKRGNVYAIEDNEQRIACLVANKEKFGVQDNLTIICAQAPQALDELPDPDVIFVGGSGGELPAILDKCWHRLALGGRLVASAVTENSKQILHQFADFVNDAEIILNTSSCKSRRSISRPLGLSASITYHAYAADKNRSKRCE